MKKILLVLFALALATNAIFAQETVKERFSGFGIISSVTGSSPTYTINVVSFTGSPRFQPNGTWVGSDVSIGDVVWFDCARYVITTVNSSGLNSLNVTVTVPSADETAGVSSPSTGQVCAVVRELSGFIPAFPVSGDNAGSGIPITLSSCLHTHYASLPVVGGADDQTAAEVTATATAPLTGTTVQAQLNELAGNTHTPVTVTDGSKVDFTLSGQNLTATIVPGSIQGSDLAQQGATTGQVLKFNGTDWVPQTDNDNQTATTVAATATAPLTGTTVQAQLNELAGNTHAPVSVTDGAQVDLTLSGQNVTAGIIANSLDSTHIKVGGLELEGLSKDGAVIGQTIKWDGSAWIPQNDSDNQTATTVSATATSPLVGTTVQAQLNELAANTHAPVTVTDNAKIDFTLTGQNITASVVNNSIDSLQIKDGSVRLLELNQSGATTGQVPVWDGSNWVSNTISSNKTEYCTDTITQSSHGFTEGTPIRYNGTSWVTTIGAYGNTISATGVVVKSISSNQFVVANCGSFPTVIADGSYYQIDATPGYGVVPDTLQVPLFKVEAGQMFVNPVFGITAGETLNFVDGSSVDFTKSSSNVTAEIAGFNAATNGYVPSKNGTSISWVALGGLPSGTDAQTLRYNGTTLEASSNIINTGTKVGIGGPIDATSKLNITGGLLTDEIRMVTNAYQSWVGGGRFRWNTNSFSFYDVNYNGYSTLSTTGGVPNIFSRTSTGFTQGTGAIGNSNYIGTIYLLQNADNYGNGFVNARYTTGGNRFAWSSWQGSDSTYIFSSMSFPVTNTVSGLTNRFGFKASGQFMLYNYTSPTSFTGTVVADLGVTSTGAVVTKSPTVASVMREESFTATAAQTAFTIAYSAPSVSGTSVPIRVYRNGVRLFYVASGPTSTQFTYTGTSVTTSANTAGDIITVEYLN